MKKKLKDIIKEFVKLRSDESADKITDDQFHNGLYDVQRRLEILAKEMK